MGNVVSCLLLEGTNISAVDYKKEINMLLFGSFPRFIIYLTLLCSFNHSSGF